MPLNRLVNASQAPRCQHTKANGDPCGAPARHGRPFCCFHDSAALRNRDFVLPIIEDAASLQIALNKILQALVDKRIDQKTATTLLYGLQIAFANMKELKFEQHMDQCARERRQRAQAAAARQNDEEEEQDNEDEPQQREEAGGEEDGENQEIVDEIHAVADIQSDHPITRSPHRPILPCGVPLTIGNRQSAIGNAVASGHPITRFVDSGGRMRTIRTPWSSQPVR